MAGQIPQGVQVLAPITPEYAQILTPEALTFLAKLHRQFNARRLELRALFNRAPGVISENANGITTGPFQVDVIVARIDSDGKLVKACVDSEESARRFLQAPIGRVAGSRAQEK